MMGRQKITNKGFIGWQGGLLLTVLGLAIVVAAFFGFKSFQKSENVQVIPTVIKQKISYVIFYPEPIAALTVDKTSFKFDATSGVLSFTAKYSAAEVTFEEQETPENFVDTPQAYDKLIETLNPYSAFNSIHGTVQLTKPKENKGQQSAVMKSNGTLIFINVTSGSLTDREWKKLFNNLEVIR